MLLFKLTVDCVVLAYDQSANQLLILLTKRPNGPQQGAWALPGSFVRQTEEFATTAQRTLQRETGIDDVYLEQLSAYSLTDPTADNRIASVAYYALINLAAYRPAPPPDSTTEWRALKEISPLPFDHEQKVVDALRRLKDTIRTRPLAHYLLPQKFTLKQLQQLYELLHGGPLDARNFRKSVKRLTYITALAESEINVSHRPAQLYQFDLETFQALATSQPI